MQDLKKFSPDGMSDLPDDGLAALATVLERTSAQCAWPYPDLTCCGREKEQAAGPYCEFHHRRAVKYSPLLSDEEHGRRQAHMRKLTLPSVLSLSVLEQL